MLIIPSLELENGKCSRCICGEPGTEEVYQHLQETPRDFIKLLRKENFKTLHLVDRDSLLHGKEINFELINDLCSSIDIPIQLHANFESYDDCKMAFDSGLYRIVLNGLALNKNIDLEHIGREFSSSKISFAMIFDGDKLSNKFHSELDLPQSLIENLIKSGCRRIVIGSLGSIFEDSDFAMGNHQEIFTDKRIRTTIYGGVNSPQQLWDLSDQKNYNADSIIIGSPLLNNVFPCQRIWRLIEAELENIEN